MVAAEKRANEIGDIFRKQSRQGMLMEWMWGPGGGIRIGQAQYGWLAGWWSKFPGWGRLGRNRFKWVAILRCLLDI